MAALLLNNPDLVRATDEMGRTGLHLAAMNGHVEEINQILAHGGDPTQKDIQGKSAMDLAVESGHKEIAHLLFRGRLTRPRRRGKDTEPKSVIVIPESSPPVVPLKSSPSGGILNERRRCERNPTENGSSGLEFCDTKCRCFRESPHSRRGLPEGGHCWRFCNR